MDYSLNRRKKGLGGMNLTPWTDVQNQAPVSPKSYVPNTTPDETSGMMDNVVPLAKLIDWQGIKPEPDVLPMSGGAPLLDLPRGLEPDPITGGFPGEVNTTGLGTTPTTAQPKAGLYDNWKTQVFNGMPLDKFVQLTGMAAHALDPQGFGGTLGKNVAQMGAHAEQGRLGYEERQAETARRDKQYEEQKTALLQQHKESRAAQAAAVGEKLVANKNASLSQKQAGMEMVNQYVKMVMPDITIPDFTVEDGAVAKEISSIAQDKQLNNEQKKESILDKMHIAGKIDDENYVKLRFPEEKAEKIPQIRSVDRGNVVDIYENGVKVRTESKGKLPGAEKAEKPENKVYVDKVNGARHVVDLRNPTHQAWLKYYGKQLVPESEAKDMEFGNDQAPVSKYQVKVIK